jgi:hypothetical protein
MSFSSSNARQCLEIWEEERREKKRKKKEGPDAGGVSGGFRFSFFPLFSSDEKTGTTHPQTPRRFVSGTG